MRLRKYVYLLMIISLAVFVFFFFIKRNERKDQSEEILQEGEEIDNISSNTIAEQEESESEKEIILDEHTLLGHMWRLYNAEEIPFVDDETFAMIREAYEEVEYTAEFETGNPEVYEEYKQKFWRLLQNEVPFLNREMGKEVYIKDWMDLEGELRGGIDLRKCGYDLFDINGDDFPELCIMYGKISIFAYDMDTDQYILWARPDGDLMVGSMKLMWYPEYDTTICEFHQLDSEGDLELETLFWAEHEDLNLGYQDINMVMFPNYADKEKRWEVTEEMKQQGIYEESSGQWFFKITDEQFKELEKPYVEAYYLGMKRRYYSYKELFGEFETDNAMPKITNMIMGTGYYIALCEDKTIWSWGNNSTGKLGTDKDSVMEPQKIEGLERVVKIVDGGKNIYALLDNGDVYFWGRDLEYLFLWTEEHILYKPVKLEGLEHIVDIDAGNNTMFALDQNGDLYALGLQCFWNGSGPEADIFQVFTGQNEKLGKDIAGIFAGAGNYHYFLRKDGTVFSIMEYFYDGDGTSYEFIFPHSADSGLDMPGADGYYFPEELEGITILNEYTKEGYTVYYDLAGINGVELVSSDNYTVFLGREDGTLWFWDSDRIKYHDDSRALANPEDGNESCEGILVEVDIRDILQEGGDSSARPCVTDMCSGLENTVFLTNTGEVFISRYTTCQVEDVSFYRRSNPDPTRLPSVLTIEDMNLKELTFEKLALTDIVSISTDGGDTFSAVDVNGVYYVIR